MKVLVYDDNPDYGGHQIMACRGIEALSSDPALEITVMLNPANTKLAERLRQIKNIQLLESPVTTRKFQGLRCRILKHGIATLSKTFSTLKPDRILCIQGEIEDSSQAVLAARRAGIECVSYLAIPHPMQLMGAKLGRLRDRANQHLLNQPNRYITLSESMSKRLKERGTTAPIDIVPNGIPAPPDPDRPARSPRPTALGMLGRIEFKQKQQDFMVHTFCNFPEAFKNCRLIIAGGGPDEEKLKALVKGKKNILLLPWQKDTEAFYSKIDILMLPSRFEGVPLVMLEALARGIPVIGSACDGMKDILPKAWTFQTEEAAALARTFSNTRSSWQADIRTIQKKVQSERSLNVFQKNFHDAVVRA